jgi:hypothetical protein
MHSMCDRNFFPHVPSDDKSLTRTGALHRLARRVRIVQEVRQLPRSRQAIPVQGRRGTGHTWLGRGVQFHEGRRAEEDNTAKQIGLRRQGRGRDHTRGSHAVLRRGAARHFVSERETIAKNINRQGCINSNLPIFAPEVPWEGRALILNGTISFAEC